MSKTIKKIIIPVILLLLAGAMAYGIYRVISGNGESGPGGPPGMGGPPGGGPPGAGGGFPVGPPAAAEVAVRTRPVTRGEVRRFIRVNGDVVTTTEVNIYPAISGKLVSLEVERGDYVAAGSVVGYVDPSRPGETYSPSPVTSTISGTVIQLPQNAGASVTTQTSIATIADLTDLRIETSIPEKFLTALKIGQSAEARFEPFPGEIFPARISRTNPVLDPVSRSLGIELAFNRTDPRIKAGMFATVILNTAERNGVLAIPRTVVLTYYGDPAVFVVKSGETAERRIIETGLQGDKMVEVTGGLEEGEILVVEGQNFLQDGDTVHIVESSE